MLTLEQRAELVVTDAWRRLPPIKRQASIAAIVLEDIGAKHGSFAPDGILTLSTRLFEGTNAAQIRMIDVNGNDPPLCEPCASRALGTTIHEMAHAIGMATGLDDTSEWLRLSGWCLSDDDPQGTARYWESRPGWFPHGPSSWRHRTGVFFCRDYSRKSPSEDFGDAVAYIALGWEQYFLGASGQAKLAYLRSEVWGENGARAIVAARQRWKKRLTGVGS